MVAPSWEAHRDGDGDGEGEGGLMLRVEGVEGWGGRRGEGVDGMRGKGNGNGKEEGIIEGEGLEALRERWERGMEELRRVVGRE